MYSKTIRDMWTERDECKDDARYDKKELMLDPSFDYNYWIALQKIAEKERRATLLSKQISIAMVEENIWKPYESEIECQRLDLQERALSLDIKLYKAEAEKIRSKEDRFSFRRPYLQLSIGGDCGLGIKNRRGQRDSSMQSAFRLELDLKMNSKHPESRREDFWCPVTNTYWPEGSMVAGHLFPWKGGEAAMEVIFGLSGSGHSELFKAENGILRTFEAEELIKGGHLVIVPDIPNHPTQQQVVTWEASDPKEYKTRVANPQHPMMKMLIWGTNKHWGDLDNQRLQFKTNFRPRVRYLYFAYCEAMLCRSFRGNHLEVSSTEPGENLWGVPGGYMFERMLLGFVEEMGHEYDHLLEGAIKEDDAVVDTTALAAASTHIQELLKDDDDDEEDSDEEDDTDEEDEEFYLSTLSDPYYFITRLPMVSRFAID